MGKSARLLRQCPIRSKGIAKSRCKRHIIEKGRDLSIPGEQTEKSDIVKVVTLYECIVQELYERLMRNGRFCGLMETVTVTTLTMSH